MERGHPEGVLIPYLMGSPRGFVCALGVLTSSVSSRLKRKGHKPSFVINIIQHNLSACAHHKGTSTVRLTVPYDTYAWHPASFPICVAVEEVWIHDTDLPCEPVGLDQIATGNVRKLAAFWRTFTTSSSVELQWIDGAPPPQIAKNFPPALA